MSQQPTFDMKAYQTAYSHLKTAVFNLFLAGQKAESPALADFVGEMQASNPKLVETLNTAYETYDKLRRKK